MVSPYCYYTLNNAEGVNQRNPALQGKEKSSPPAACNMVRYQAPELEQFLYPVGWSRPK